MANWVQVCTLLNGQSRIYSLAVFEGRLYGGTGTGGRLFRMNLTETAWEQVCGKFLDRRMILSLTVFENRLYGGTENGDLYRLNLAGNSWERICGILNSQLHMKSLIVFEGRLYCGTGFGGRLFILNLAGNAWEQICAQLNGQGLINSLAVFEGRLYGSTSPGGRLFRLNFARNAWEQVCAELNGQGLINSLAVFEGRLYGSTSPGGRLFRLNFARNAWEQVCETLEALHVFDLIVYDNDLYGCTGISSGSYGGYLYRLNDLRSAWEQICGYLPLEYVVFSLEIYNDRLYGGTFISGKLYRLKYLLSANFTAIPLTGFRPLVVQFTNETVYDLDKPTYLWTFGNGLSSTGFAPAHRYSSVGFFTVSLTATNAVGVDIFTRIDYIEVIELLGERVSNNSRYWPSDIIDIDQNYHVILIEDQSRSMITATSIVILYIDPNGASGSLAGSHVSDDGVVGYVSVGLNSIKGKWWFKLYAVLAGGEILEGIPFFVNVQAKGL